MLSSAEHSLLSKSIHGISRLADLFGMISNKLFCPTRIYETFDSQVKLFKAISTWMSWWLNGSKDEISVVCKMMPAQMKNICNSLKETLKSSIRHANHHLFPQISLFDDLLFCSASHKLHYQQKQKQQQKPFNNCCKTGLHTLELREKQTEIGNMLEEDMT